MAATCAIGTFGRLAVLQGSSPYVWGGTRLPFMRENIHKRGKHIHPPVILGTRFEDAERVRTGTNFYGGVVTFPVDPGNLVTLLPLMLGGTPAGTTFPLAETVPTFGCLIDKVTRRFEYLNGAVNRWSLSGTQHGPDGQPNWVTLAIEMWFKSETPDTVFPALTLPKDAQYTAFTFEDVAITMQGAARKPKQFTLMGHNHLHARWVNDLNPVLFCPTRSTVALSVVFPYDDDHDDLHNLPLTPAAGSLVLANGSISTQFNFGSLVSPDNTPTIPGFTEINQPVIAVARKNGATPSLNVINDSTP